jgi:hypothetical protein
MLLFWREVALLWSTVERKTRKLRSINECGVE